MKRKTKIICTIGPASQKESTLLELVRAGMDIARVNFSHGDESCHRDFISKIRKLNRRFDFDIKILQDLEGYRMRIGFLSGPILLKSGEKLLLVNDKKPSRGSIPIDYDGVLKDFKNGMDIFIDDGLLVLKVIGSSDNQITAKVLRPGLLKSRKGINIPQLILKKDILTKKDSRDIEFGVDHRVDFIAQSFVRNAHDLQAVINQAGKRLPECQFIAKIENKDGVTNLQKIIPVSDGIMIARGDLGISLPIHEVPFIQKDIIRQCRERGEFVITATQMLESMCEHYFPTRAEVSDIANAILDGTDAVMLSAETAVGRYPVESVAMMRQIIDYAESQR